MFRMGTWLTAVASVALVASSCAVSEERSGPGADGIPAVVVACAEDQPDCQDTVSTGNLPTGGEDPLAPSGVPDRGSASGGMVAEGGLSVADAVAYKGSGPVAVHGYVVRTSTTARLCEALAESYPPQCGGASLNLANIEVTDGLPLVEEGDVQWSPDLVVLIGTMAGNELTLEADAST